MFAVLPNIKIRLMKNAQWEDTSLETNPDASVDNIGSRMPVPCPDISTGYNSASFSALDTVIENLLAFSCPVTANSDLLYAVYTLGAKEILQAGFFSRAQNMHNRCCDVT